MLQGANHLRGAMTIQNHTNVAAASREMNMMAITQIDSMVAITKEGESAGLQISQCLQQENVTRETSEIVSIHPIKDSAVKIRESTIAKAVMRVSTIKRIVSVRNTIGDHPVVSANKQESHPVKSNNLSTQIMNKLKQGSSQQNSAKRNV